MDDLLCQSVQSSKLLCFETSLLQGGHSLFEPRVFALERAILLGQRPQQGCEPGDFRATILGHPDDRRRELR